MEELDKPETIEVDFTPTGNEPLLHVEVWRNAGNKRRHKIQITSPWVDFKQISLLQQILDIDQFLLEVVEKAPVGEGKEKPVAISSRVLQYLESKAEAWTGTNDILDAVQGSPSKVKMALRTMVRTGMLEAITGSGRGQQSQYRINHNRTQSVSDPQGTVNSSYDSLEADLEAELS